MTEDEKLRTALFRYGVISDLETGATDAPSNNAFFRQAAEKSYVGPNGTPTTVGASTVEKWHLAYRKGGFDALLPQSRKDEGVSRKLAPEIQEQIQNILTDHPHMTAAGIFRALQTDGSIDIGEVSQSTIERFIRNFRNCAGISQNKDMRRYERAHINEVWYGDTCFGPYMTTKEGKKRVYIIALIDDASRFIVGADVFFNDNFENFMQVIRSAVMKYGYPRLFQLDNGPTYHNDQMRLLAARIGSSVHYCEPYTPTAKSKIERWWKSLRSIYLSTLDMKQYHDLDAFRKDFLDYVAQYNMTVHSSLNGQTPQERFFSEPEYIRRLSQEQIDQSFLLEVERRVSADCVVNLNSQEYEVHYRYAKKKIRLRYSPDMETVYVVEPSGTLTPIRLLNKKDNAVVKRERFRLSDGGEDNG